MKLPHVSGCDWLLAIAALPGRDLPSLLLFRDALIARDSGNSACGSAESDVAAACDACGVLKTLPLDVSILSLVCIDCWGTWSSDSEADDRLKGCAYFLIGVLVCCGGWLKTGPRKLRGGGKRLFLSSGFCFLPEVWVNCSWGWSPR